MSLDSRLDPKRVLGRSPDQLSPEEATALAGQWIALETYSPQNAALRRIEAIGASVEECIGQLTARGLDPRHFEFRLLKPPF